MAIKIKGFHDESQVITDSDTSIKLDKKAFVHYGGDIDLSDLIPEEGEEAPTGFSLLFGYGIAEDIATTPDISGNSYKIDGKVTGLLGAVTTFGDETTIKIGKTAELSAGLGIGITNITEMSEDIFESLTIGTVYAAGHNSKITIAKGAEINGLFGVAATGLGSSVTNGGDIDAGIVGMLSGNLNLGGLAPALGGAMMAAPMAAGAAATTTKMTNNGNIDSLIGIAGFQSDNQVLTNGKKGEIEGLVGMIGGTIPIGEAPVEFGTLKLQNSGEIIAAVGMLGMISPDMTLINAKGAEIISGVIGMGAFSMDGMSSTITNAGTIRVTLSLVLPDEMAALVPISSAAIFGFAGAETVENSGKVYGDVFLGGGNDMMTNTAGLIDGNVVLGDGNDTFDYAGGKVTGTIYGGLGDDTLIVDKANKVLVELDAGGTDTVISSVSYTLNDFVERLALSGKGDIDATGNALDNRLEGNAGDNTLTGGAGIDTFVFGTKGGTDTIADFATLLEKATDVDGSVQIKDGNDILIINGVLEAALVETDFTFAV